MIRRAALLACATCAVAALPTAGARASGVPALPDGDGIHVVSERQLDARLLALTVSTPALNGTANIRVLLPDGYAAHPLRRYPVLYLLHGTSGGAADWTTMGDAEKTTTGRQLIVVMPDIAQNDNGGGWCTDWYNAGAGGKPEWERFHIEQLIPWIDGSLRTVADRDGRAIAGLSQGGFCSMSYAARHPDLFSEALSFSGAPDIAYDTEAQALVTPIINATETALDGVAPYSMFGPRTTQEINWAAHDPTTLAENLRGMRLIIDTGNGESGPLDSAVPNPGAMTIESGVHELSTLFHNRLQALGIPSTFDDYGPGTHSWPYWARDLQWAIGPVMDGFAHPPAAAAAVTYTSADAVYGAFGWTVKTSRQVQELSTLRSATATGFELQGSGSATVITPARYRRSSRYRITIHAGSATTHLTLGTGRGRRLAIEVPLGPSDTVQEYPGGGPALGTTVDTTRVAITYVKPRRTRRQHRRAG